MPLSVSARLGPYEILAPLGAGGMGEVYRARDTRLDRQVAVKVLSGELAGSPEALSRFEREAKAIAALSHPNILAIHDFGQADGTFYVVTELLEGETLRSRLTLGALPARKAVEYALQLAHGLAAAHEKGIVHRDLKPDNIFLGKAGPLKILDFGLARYDPPAADGEGSLSPTIARATDAGTVLGTVGYMSPEQVRGRAVDHRSDIFSFGCVLYEMLSGRRAFRAESAVETMAAIIRDEAAELSEVALALPPGLARIVRHCLEKDPEERFQSARDLGFDLLSLSSDSASGRISARAPRARARWPAAALAALCVAGAFALGRTTAPRPAGAFRATFAQLTDEPGVEGSPRLSPDGGSLLYVSEAAGNSDVYLLRVGGHNPLNLTKACDKEDTAPAFSPNGAQIAYRSECDGGGIFTMGSTGESLRRVTDFGHDPSWSPDGHEIAVADEGVNDPYLRYQVSALWAVKVTDGSKRLLTKGDAVQPSWSPHGHRIAFWAARDERASQRDLATVPASGPSDESAVAAVTDDAPLDWSPAWSPDGRHLYFASDRGGTMNLWRVAVDETTGRVLRQPEPLTTPSLAAERPSLSRDGGLVAYASASLRSSLQRVAFDERRGVATGAPTEIWSSSGTLQDTDASGDGHWVVLRHSTGPVEDLVAVRADGSGHRRLTEDPHRDRVPRFSPDGHRIAFYSNRSGRYEIWEVGLDGSGLRQLSDHVGAESFYFPAWSHDGRHLAAVDQVGGTWLLDLEPPRHQWVPRYRAERGEMWVTSLDWSRDGRFFAGDTKGGGRAAGIFVESLESGARRRLTDSGESPRWLGDSRRLLYQRDGGLWLLDTATGASSKVISPPKPPRTLLDFGLAADDRWLVFVELTRESDIWLTRLE